MADTPNLNLPYMLAAQAQKHVTHNEALRMLDAIVQLSVLDRDLMAPPASPANGDRYIVAASPTGAWAGQAQKIAAFQDSAWMFYTPKEGWLAWVADENVVAVFDGSGWALVTGGGGGSSDHGLLTGLGDDDHPQYHNNARGDARYLPVAPSMVGINATADTTNRLALASTASLFNHVGNGHQIKVNKNAAGDTASFLFQTNFSGRAEFGTTGDDNFHIKVSNSGSSWIDALQIVASNGNVGVGKSPSAKLDVNGGVAVSGIIQTNVEGGGLIVDAAGFQRFGFVKESGYNPEFRYSNSVPFVVRRVTGGTIVSISSSDTPLVCAASGFVGIGTASPSYQLQVATDSAAKPSTSTWTVASDARLKDDIGPANLARCWEIVKSIPLKRYTWKDDAYASEQVADRSKLGWIAQDVQPFFKNAVLQHVFHRPPVEDGVEDYEEQVTTERIVEREASSIEMRDGRPVLVRTAIAEALQEPVFDLVPVIDASGNAVADGDGAQLTHPVPRMIKKSRPRLRTDTIDDCLSLNSDQLYAAMYGALQLAMQRIERLEAEARK